MWTRDATGKENYLESDDESTAVRGSWRNARIRLPNSVVIDAVYTAHSNKYTEKQRGYLASAIYRLRLPAKSLTPKLHIYFTKHLH